MALTGACVGRCSPTVPRGGHGRLSCVKPFDDLQLAETLSHWLTPVDAPLEVVECVELPIPLLETPVFGSVIDMAVIDGLRALDSKGGKSRLLRAVSRFTEVAAKLATTIHEEFEKNDTETVWRAAHSLKSSAGALGAWQLAGRCAQIERHARDSDIEQTRPHVAALDHDLTAALRDLRALMGELPTTEPAGDGAAGRGNIRPETYMCPPSLPTKQTSRRWPPVRGSRSTAPGRRRNPRPRSLLSMTTRSSVPSDARRDGG